MDAPEGFVPFEFVTPFGTLMLPDRRCTSCIFSETYWACTACVYREGMREAARIEVDRRERELQEYIKEHPEAVIYSTKEESK